MIDNFPVLQAYNPGGYMSFKFIPVNQVTSYPMISQGRALVKVQALTDWLDGYATKETLSYEEDPQTDENGSYYNLSVTGFTPGASPELIDIMDTLSLYQFMLILKDPLGILRLVGSPAAPLDFSSKFISGTTRPDAKGFNFKFSGQSLYRSPVYPA